MVRGNIKSFEKPFTHAEVVALAERTLKRFGGDRNKAGRYARSMEDRYESAKWAQVVEVIVTGGRHHATMKKSPTQLDREIAEVLSRGSSPRRHHATRQAGAAAWDVAMDAILEHDPKKAARIVRAIREEHGVLVDATPEFSQAVLEAPQHVRDRFFELTLKDQEDLGARDEIHKRVILGLKPGAKIFAHGHPGKIVRITPRETVEVRLPGGVAEVGPEDVQLRD